MENLRLLLVITVLCTVLSDGLAQSRGSSRYSPAEEEQDGAVTSPPRLPPSRRASLRRRKPTPTPEPTEINKELPDYQLPKREGTTARRVPSRAPVEEFAPHVPDAPVLPDKPIVPAVVDESPQITTSAPEDKTQGRKRRPKKRRRPQNGVAKPAAANGETLDVTEPEKSRVPVPELLNTDLKRPEPFSVNPERIRNPNKFDSPPGLEEKPLWSDDKFVNTADDSGRRNPEPAVPYYPPQHGTNRLPLEDGEIVESARGLSEPTNPSYQDIPDKRYSLPVDEPPSRASYVPVLNPIRVPSESRSRVPDRSGSQRTPINRTPSTSAPEVFEERKVPATRAPQNFIPHDNQPRTLEKALPEVRLPVPESPFHANEFADRPGFESAEELLERLQEEGNPAVEGIDLQGPDVASRLPIHGEAPFDDAYPPYSDIGAEERSAPPVPHRREEDIPPVPRPSFNDIQPQETPKRQSTNNVDTESKQISRYEPPLQRGGFGGRGSERSEITRSSASQDKLPTQVPTRGRGSSRYEPQTAPEEFSRTRSSSRFSSDSSTNTPTRTRGSQAPSQAPTRSRNTQRYQPDPAESRARGTRRQPVDPEYTEESPVEDDYSRRAPEYKEESPVEADYLRRDLPIDQTHLLREQVLPDREHAVSDREQALSVREQAVSAREQQTPRLTSRRQQNRNAARPNPVAQRGPPLREQSVPVREQVVPDREQAVSDREQALSAREQAVSERERQAHRQTFKRQQDRDAANLHTEVQRGPPLSEQAVPVREQVVPDREHAVSNREQALSAREQAVTERERQTHRQTSRRQQNRNAAKIREQAEQVVPDREQAVSDREQALSAREQAVSEREQQAPRQTSRRQQNRNAARPHPVDQRGPPLREQVVPVREQIVPDRERAVSDREQALSMREQAVSVREELAPRQTSRRQQNRNAVRPQPQPDYRAPEENIRYQPEYQAPPQNTRNQARPVPQTDAYQERQSVPRQQSRPRQFEPGSNQGRASGSSKFDCPQPYGFFAHPVQCDKYYECRNGTAIENLCQDGLAFNEAAAPKILRCDSLRDVDCSKRPELQEPRPTQNCPRRYGMYAHEIDCTKFFNCVDGTATEVQCPQGLTFNDDKATCDWADLVQSSCKTEELLGFTCPEPNAHDLQDGVYTTYPHPDNCQLHFFCIKGEDGLRRPRLLTCHEGLVYNPVTKQCDRLEEVPGCEDFYGSRSPPPKSQRKPAREPIREPIEPEEYDEPATPTPRRRLPQNRRQRN